MLPVLIVCYLRPNDLEVMLEKHIVSERKIYIFIDKAEDKGVEENKKVLEIAKTFETRLDLKIRMADFNLGVGRAVPEAINWISANEEKFIILEDDCHLNDNGFEFLDNYSALIRGEVSLLCATSPWDINENSRKFSVNSVSKYPLISGWATTSQSWKEISILIGKTPSIKFIFGKILTNPKNILAIAFFLSAHIRVLRKKSQAWDCSVALAMLLLRKKSIIPNVTMVTNTGRDNVAAHTLPSGDEDRFFRLESKYKPSEVVVRSREFQKLTDRKIELDLYGMKKRHLLSPVKALFF